MATYTQHEDHLDYLQGQIFAMQRINAALLLHLAPTEETHKEVLYTVEQAPLPDMTSVPLPMRERIADGWTAGEEGFRTLIDSLK